MIYSLLCRDFCLLRTMSFWMHVLVPWHGVGLWFLRALKFQKPSAPTTRRWAKGPHTTSMSVPFPARVKSKLSLGPILTLTCPGSSTSIIRKVRALNGILVTPGPEMEPLAKSPRRGSVRKKKKKTFAILIVILKWSFMFVFVGLVFCFCGARPPPPHRAPYHNVCNLMETSVTRGQKSTEPVHMGKSCRPFLGFCRICLLFWVQRRAIEGFRPKK